MLYELITPSDSITFEAATFEAAVGATLMIGRGKAPADPIDLDEDESLDKYRIPILFLTSEDGLNKWLNEHGIQSIAKLYNDHKEDIADALASFCTGTAQDRKLYDTALDHIDDDDRRREFKAKWDDERRTSMSEWTNVAHDYAEKLRASE